MCQYLSNEEIIENCNDPDFCVVCLCTRNDVKVDKYHICEECHKGSTEVGRPRRLPVVTIKGKNYFRDDRLREFRNIHVPHDIRTFDDNSKDVKVYCNHCGKLLFTGTENQSKGAAIYCPDCE